MRYTHLNMRSRVYLVSCVCVSGIPTCSFCLLFHFPLEDCSVFGNFVITLIHNYCYQCLFVNYSCIKWVSSPTWVLKVHLLKLIILHSSSIFVTDLKAFVICIWWWSSEMGSCPTIIEAMWLMLKWYYVVVWLCVDFYFSNYQKIYENDIGILLLFVSPKSTKNIFIDYWYHICLRPHWHYCKMWKQVCFVKISLDILCYYLSCIVYVGVHITYRI